MDAVDVVRQYLARINSGDAAGLASLVTVDHRFVDATGRVHDRGLTEEGWQGYFALFPDYHIDLETIFASGDTVAAFGTARGSFQGRGVAKPEVQWSFPGAWRAVVKEGKLAEWRVYADIEAMMQSMGVRRFT